MCCTEWIASGRGDHEGLFLPKEVLEKVTPLSGPWSKQQLFSYSHFLSHSLRIHFAHWSSTTKSHRSGANNQKKKKKKFATRSQYPTSVGCCALRQQEGHDGPHRFLCGSLGADGVPPAHGPFLAPTLRLAARFRLKVGGGAVQDHFTKDHVLRGYHLCA